MRAHIITAAVVLALGACGGGGEVRQAPGTRRPQASQPRAARGQDAGVPIDDGPPLPPLTLRDDQFSEAESNRDPFRSYAHSFLPQSTRAAAVQRVVIMPRTSIEEMRLIAIVSGLENPRAMIIDREGTGHIVTRGDYLGRAEVVETGGEQSVPVTLNWRVDRIRGDELVLTREDPAGPNRPPVTRVIALHQAEDTTERR